MEDILASIRRILNEDETPGPGQAASQPAAPSAGLPPEPAVDDVLVLDPSMLAPEQPAAHKPVEAAATPPEPAAIPAPVAAPGLITAATETAAAKSVGSLLRTLTAERATQLHRGGPTIEDLVREEIRPLLSAWLDTHLPPMVERLVRAEIERVMGRAAP